MKKRFSILLTILLLVSLLAAALAETDAAMTGHEWYEKGQTAYEAKDYQTARECFEKAAESGNHKAMNKTGTMYSEGEGVPQDYAIALEWYQKAADLGNSNAMLNLGVRYYFGEGVPQDDLVALVWFQKAAYFNV